MNPDRDRGVTLIELIVTVSVATTLMTVAVPSFVGFVNNNRTVAFTNRLVASLNLARSESVKRNVVVSLCKSANPNDAAPTCSVSAATGWESGWVTFVDDSTQGTLDGTDVRLRIDQPEGDGSIGADGDSISYQYDGSVVAGRTFTVCVGGNRRTIAINTTGRIQITKGSC